MGGRARGRQPMSSPGATPRSPRASTRSRSRSRSRSRPSPAAIVVTGAGGPLGVNACRSLARAPEPPRMIGTDANRWHLPLSECDRTYLVPLARDRDAYADALLEIAQRERAVAVLPTHPVEVRAVAELAAAGRLPGLGVALPDPAVIAVCDDKAATHAALAAAGVSVPRTVSLARPADVDRAFAELRADPGDPVWVRGSGAPGLGIGGAALPCRDPGVARAWVDHHRGWGRMSASEYLPGANLSWMALFDRGVLIAGGCRERLEYVLPHVSPSGITGAPAVSRTVDRPEVAALGERAVRAVHAAHLAAHGATHDAVGAAHDGESGPHGAYFVDLKCDAAGAPRITEINAGRCGTTVLAYTEAGVNFPWLLTKLARGLPCPPHVHPAQSVEPDVYWLRTLDCGPVALRGDAALDRYPRAPRAPRPPRVRAPAGVNEPRNRGDDAARGARGRVPTAAGAALFDLDGTLVYLDVDIAKVRGELAAFFAPRGYSREFRPILPRIDEAARQVARDEAERVQLIAAARAMIDRAEVEAAARASARAFAAQVVRVLADRGFALGIITNNGRACVPAALSRLGEDLAPLFRVIVTRDDVTAAKPDPEGVLRAVRALAPDGGEVLLIGDSAGDVEAGRAAREVLAREHDAARALSIVALAEGAGSYQDLMAARPDRLIWDPHELLSWWPRSLVEA